MPIVDDAYVSPTWRNNQPPALNATEMQAITDTVEGNQDDIAALQVQVAAIGDGSPKGVYPTLAALQAAFPTGTQGIYVVTADGHWYYWNGTAWTDGGQYKADITILQTTGQSTTNVMSQKAVTDELDTINTALDSYGFSVVNGKLCVTYTV